MYNPDNFFSGLQVQIEKMIEYGFIKESTKSDYFFSEDINSIISYLKDYEYIKGKWEI